MAIILVVEDDPIVSMALTTVLKATGHTVRVAGDGLAALDVLKAEVPDVVLTDYMMPRLDGGGLIRAVRAEPRWAHLPIILLSGTPAFTDGIAGLGHDLLLTKPIGVPGLLSAVDTVLARPVLAQAV